MFKKTINQIQLWLIKHIRAIEFWFIEFFDQQVKPYRFHDGKSSYEPTDYSKSNKVRSRKNSKKADGNPNPKTLSK